MQPIITPEMRQALDENGGLPLEIVDPASQEKFVVLRAAVFEKLRRERDEQTRYLLQEMGRRAGWDDPVMDAYDALDPRQP